MWNPAAERMFGWLEAEILGLHNPLCLKEEFQEFCGRVRGIEIFHNFELFLHKRDGFPMDVSLSTATLHDASGNIAGIMTILSDITQRKAVERVILQLEDKFSKVFRYSPDWISICSLSTGRFIDANDTCKVVTGFSREKVIGRSD